MDEFLLVVVTMSLALLSPGPDFAFILKQSVHYGKKTSIYTSLGLGVGVMVHVTYSVLGVGLIISKSATIFSIVKYLGAFYLIFIGYKSLLSKGFHIHQDKVGKIESMSFQKAFSLGFLCNLLNPKAALFFISLFTVVINVNTPFYMLIVYAIYAVVSTFTWFSALSLLLSHQKVRAFFNHFGKYFDFFMGLVLIALGLKIAFVQL